MLKNYYQRAIDYLRKYKLVFSIIVMFMLILLFVIPVRCHTTVYYPRLESGDVVLSETWNRSCISVYRKEFWTDYDLLAQDVQFLWGFSVLRAWFHSDNVQYKNKIQTIIIHP